MQDAHALFGVLCFIVVTVLAVTFIGAVFLRAAVAIYNWLAGGAGAQSGVPTPHFLKAMTISVNTTIVNGGVGFLIGLAMIAGSIDTGPDGEERASIAAFIGFLICLVVMAGMLMVMLPTNLGKALFVTLCYMGMVGLLAVGVAVWTFVVLSVVLR